LRLIAAARDTQLAGAFIPRGTVLLASTSASYAETTADPAFVAKYDATEARRLRGCDYWHDADPGRFDPSRWLAADGTFDARAGPFNSFTSGVRGCWGRPIAVRRAVAS
jgi:hypothetical protein